MRVAVFHVSRLARIDVMLRLYTLPKESAKVRKRVLEEVVISRSDLRMT